MRLKNGFTLVELLAVIAIIAILAVAAVSGYSTLTRNSKNKALEQKIKQIEIAAEKYAKEQNLEGTVTISVNKLVIMGYLQPDKSSDDGYAVITNPVNAENMICDLVTIRITNDSIIAEHVDGEKDCNISSSEMEGSKIQIKAFEYNRTATDQIPYNPSLNEYDWTRDSVLIYVTSEYFDDIKYANNKAIKVTYEYGGNSIEKSIKSDKKSDSPSSNIGTKYKEDTYNELLIKDEDVGLIFNRELRVVITMKDGTTHIKTTIIKIDLEAPSGYLVVRGDFITTNSTREVKIFFDDSNGSGIDGYAISETENGGIGLDYGEYDGKENIENGGIFHVGLKGKYYIYIRDKVGNISKPLIFDNDNYDVPNDSIACYMYPYNSSGTRLTPVSNWLNKDFIVKTHTSVALGSNGVKGNLLRMKAKNIRENHLTEVFRNKRANAVIDEFLQTNETRVTEFATGLKSLEKNSTIHTCSSSYGLDKTSPTVSFRYDNYDNYNKLTQKHSVDITFEDALSGFVNTVPSGLAFEYGWSTSSTMPPSSWESGVATIQSGRKSAKATITTESFKDEELTGIYYFWINGGVTKDLAQNYLGDSVLNYGFKFDNTPPNCTSSGGNTNWTKGSRTLLGRCQDTGSVQSGCVKMTIEGYTYTNAGNVKKSYSNEFNSSNESPGKVYDAAGNSTDCPSDQTVRIDKTAPSCSMTTGEINNDSSVTVSISDVKDTEVSGVGSSGVSYYNINNEAVESTTHSEGSATYKGNVIDNAGNAGSCDITLYKLTYNANAVGATSQYGYKFGVKGKPWGALGGATLDFYTITAWNTHPWGWGSNENGSSIVTDNLNLYAMWRENVVNIYYNSNGGYVTAEHTKFCNNIYGASQGKQPDANGIVHWSSIPASKPLNKGVLNHNAHYTDSTIPMIKEVNTNDCKGWRRGSTVYKISDRNYEIDEVDSISSFKDLFSVHDPIRYGLLKTSDVSIILVARYEGCYNKKGDIWDNVYYKPECPNR